VINDSAKLISFKSNLMLAVI